MKTARQIIRLGLIFGWVVTAIAQPAAPPVQADFGDAILHEWVQPEYPEAAKAAKIEGRVQVEFVVEADGHVTRAAVKKSTDERFNASALAAVQRWVFEPAVAETKPVASGMQVTVVFKLEQLRQKRAPLAPPEALLPSAMPVAPPKMTFSPDPDYPVELEERKVPGQVILEFLVEPDGTADQPKVLWTPDAAFVGEALRTLEKYRFEPAHQGPLPLRSKPTQGTMEFQTLGVDRAGLLVANGITVNDPGKFREPPRPAVLPEPVYPRERLLAGESGTATVEFTVTDRGATKDVLLKEASQPEFGAALVAAVEAWVFDAALINDQPAEAKLVVAQKFIPPVAGNVARLIQAMQPGGAGIGGAKGLDQRIRPVWRTGAVYPRALRVDKPAGQAVIEFIIDREGRVRLPRIVSATREEFGWAGVTAISQWVFAPPVRGGQPVDVKANIPMDFVPPKD